MSIDSLIANPGRLRILTALAQVQRQEFVELRRTTQMTDGNLATHARRLQLAGMLDIDKSFRAGKPVTTFTLTPQGREALESHINELLQALKPVATEAQLPNQDGSLELAHSTAPYPDSDWID